MLSLKSNFSSTSSHYVLALSLLLINGAYLYLIKKNRVMSSCLITASGYNCESISLFSMFSVFPSHLIIFLCSRLTRSQDFRQRSPLCMNSIGLLPKSSPVLIPTFFEPKHSSCLIGTLTTSLPGYPLPILSRMQIAFVYGSLVMLHLPSVRILMEGAANGGQSSLLVKLLCISPNFESHDTFCADVSRFSSVFLKKNC